MRTTAFDLIAHPDAIHTPWGFLAIFWVAGLFLVLITVVAWRHRWNRWRRAHSTILAALWWCALPYVSWTEIAHVRAVRTAAQDGRFLTVHGCLSAFHAGARFSSKDGSTDEVWSVGGETFEYGAGNVGFAWHRVEAAGGSVHADTLVDVAFIRNEDGRRNEILRLIVQQHACPSAPDPGVP